MNEETVDTADLTIEWEGGNIAVAVKITSAIHLTPDYIGKAVSECLTAALSKESEQCQSN